MRVLFILLSLTRELISLITLIAEGKGQEELYSSKITEILELKDVVDDSQFQS